MGLTGMRACAGLVPVLLSFALSGYADAPPSPAAAAFASIDRDHDGRVTVEEYVASQESAIARRFAGIDRNRDGWISASELDEARRLSEARLDQLAGDDPARNEFTTVPAFAEIDTDGNARITPQEFAAAQADALKARFARLDENADGALSPAEFEAARQRFMQLLGSEDTDDSKPATDAP